MPEAIKGNRKPSEVQLITIAALVVSLLMQLTIIAALMAILIYWLFVEFLHWPVLIVLLFGVVLLLLSSMMRRGKRK